MSCANENLQNPVKEDVSRRDFLSWILKGGIFITLGGMLAPALTYLLPVTQQGPVGGMVDVGGAEDIPVGAGKKIILSGSAILLIRMTDGYRAYSAICTHLGCLVDWDAQKREIVCPCHAGIFNDKGAVVSGPPPRPLPSYTVKVVNGRVMVAV